MDSIHPGTGQDLEAIADRELERQRALEAELEREYEEARIAEQERDLECAFEDRDGLPF